MMKYININMQETSWW